MMSENKHTPGPWSYWSGYNHVNEIEAQVTAEGGDIVIASFNSLIEQGEANACLMAASPELLEMLAALECDINTMLYCYDKRPENFWYAMDTAKKNAERARSIIAKARGEV